MNADRCLRSADPDLVSVGFPFAIWSQLQSPSRNPPCMYRDYAPRRQVTEITRLAIRLGVQYHLYCCRLSCGSYFCVANNQSMYTSGKSGPG